MSVGDAKVIALQSNFLNFPAIPHPGEGGGWGIGILLNFGWLGKLET
jgi:hypothetical protein